MSQKFDHSSKRLHCYQHANIRLKADSKLGFLSPGFFLSLHKAPEIFFQYYLNFFGFRTYSYSTCFRLLNQPRGILERLNAGEVVIGDGGFLHALEKRGYLKAGPYTPECTVEHPEAGWYMQS